MDVYSTPKRFVVNYLEKKYGFDDSEAMWNEKSISKLDIAFLIDHIIPKSIVYDKQMQLDDRVLTEYKKRYNKSVLSDCDIKCIISSMKLKEAYKRQKEKSSKTILVDKIEHDIEPKQPIKNTPKSIPKKYVEIVINYCKAFKMNGEKCNAKVKDGTCLCKRHKIKSKS